MVSPGPQLARRGVGFRARQPDPGLALTRRHRQRIVPAPAIRVEDGFKVRKRVLIVCIGNICRSPTAEVLFRHHAPEVIVSSAGIAALSGEPMDPMALAVLDEHGLDGRHHVARQLHDSLILQADLVLGMEPAHVDGIKRGLPSAAGRTFLLDAWRRQEGIADPFGQQRPAFEHAYDVIDAAVQAWLPHLDSV